METRSMSAMRGDALRLVAIGAVAGLLAGMIMALTEMIYGWASSAHSAWDAPMGIWAWLWGLNYFGQPADHIWPIILGLGGHLVNSIILGVIFVVLVAAARLRNDALTIVLGVAYALVAWVIMRYGILPLRDSTKELFTTSMISPMWVWWVAHGLYGLTLGTAYVAVRRARTRPLARVMRMREEMRRAAA
jgi:hypothetical protein